MGYMETMMMNTNNIQKIAATKIATNIEPRFRIYQEKVNRNRKNSIKPILRPLNHGYPLQQDMPDLVNAMHALGRFTYNNKNRDYIGNIGGIFDALIASLSNPSDSIKADAALTLGNLALNQTYSRKIGAYESTFNTLTDLISNNLNSAVKANAAFALGNLALNQINSDNIGQVDQIFNMLTDLLDHESDSVKNKAAVALGNLAINQTNSATIAQVDRILDVLTNLLNNGSVSDKWNAAHVLSKLAFNIVINKENINQLNNITNTIIQLSQNSETFKEISVRILANLSYKNHQTIGEVDRIFDFLAFLLSSTSDSIKQNTVVALGNLALNETHCQIIGQVDHIFFTLAALLYNKTDSIKAKAAFALGNLARNETNRVKIGQIDLIFDNLISLASNGSQQVTYHATSALENLALNEINKEKIDQINGQNNFLAIVDWIRRFFI